MIDVNEKNSYAASFGNLPNKTIYQSGMCTKANVDMRPELKSMFNIGMKALVSTTGGAGTAGNALVPIYLDPRIVDRSRKFTPWREIIPRVTNVGKEADFNIVSAKGAAVFAGENQSLTEQDDTISRSSTSVKFLYAKGRVSGVAQAAIPSYILQGFSTGGTGLQGTAFSDQSAPNAMQLEVLARSRALAEKEEDAIWNGDASSNSLEFSGLVALQGTTNQNDLASSALVYDDVEESVRAAFDDSGRPTIAGCSSSVLEDLRKIMIDTFAYRPQDMQQTLPFGVTSHLVLETMVGALPVVPSQQLSNTTGAKQIFFLDADWIEMRVLQDMTFENKPDEDDSKVFLLKMYECLLNRFPAAHSFIDNIA